MKHILWTACLALSLTACFKDEVAEADLTTNPFDADYDGEPFIEFVSDETIIFYDNNFNPIDTAIKFIMRVRTDLFPSPVAYVPYAVHVDDGTIYEGNLTPPTSTEFSVLHTTVLDGVNYCLDVSIKSQGSNTRSYRFCATADL